MSRLWFIYLVWHLDSHFISTHILFLLANLSKDTYIFQCHQWSSSLFSKHVQVHWSLRFSVRHAFVSLLCNERLKKCASKDFNILCPKLMFSFISFYFNCYFHYFFWFLALYLSFSIYILYFALSTLNCRLFNPTICKMAVLGRQTSTTTYLKKL